MLLNYVTYELTLTAVEEIKRHPESARIMIVVVDNDSPNESAAILDDASNRLSFNFIRNESNSGYAAGNNVGLRFAFANGATIGIVMNNDIVLDGFFPPDGFSRIANDLEKPPIACITPRIMKPGGAIQHQDIFRPTLFDLTLGKPLFLLRKLRSEPQSFALIYRPQGCFMAMQLNMLSECGFLDEGTFLYGEEDILAERMLQKGFLCACDPTIVVMHNHSQTVKSAFEQAKIFGMVRKSFIYYLSEYRHFSPWSIALCNSFKKLEDKLRLICGKY